LNPPDVYDNLADGYDAAMEAVAQNVITRRAVRETVLSHTTNHAIALDFGGGTGLDLEWLSEAFDRVYFVEPSAKMRARALERGRGRTNIVYDQNNNFLNWNAQSFDPPPSVVLANFAVLNSILEVKDFFSALYKCTAPQALFFMVALNAIPGEHSFLKNLLNGLRVKFAKRSILCRGEVHNTIIHPEAVLRTAARDWFGIESVERLPDSQFTLYIFRRR
jgi:hypothetical protein